MNEILESMDKQLCKLDNLESGFYKTKLFLMYEDIDYYRLTGEYSFEELNIFNFYYLFHHKKYFNMFDSIDIIVKYENGNDYVTECISGTEIPIAKDCIKNYYRISNFDNSSCFNCSTASSFVNYNIDSYNKKYKLMFPYFVCVLTEGLDIHMDGKLDISNATFFPCALEEIKHLTVKKGSEPMKLAYELPEKIFEALKAMEKKYGTIEDFEKHLNKLLSINEKRYIDWVESEFTKENADLSNNTHSFIKKSKRRKRLAKFKNQEY